MILLPGDHDKEVKDEEAEKLCDLLKENNIKGYVSVAWASSDEQYDTYLTDDFIRGTYDLYGYITINEDTTEIEWR